MRQNTPSSLNLAFSANENYYTGLETSIASAIASSSANTGRFNIFIVDGGLSESRQQQLRTQLNRLAEERQVSVNLQWLDMGEANKNKLAALKNSATYYARILLPELIPDHDRVLWMDSDMLCLKDLSGIDGMLKNGTLAAGVVDAGIPTLADEGPETERLNTRHLDLTTPYINTGFLLMDLDLWRKENITDQLIAWGKANGGFSRYHDQAMINWQLADRLTQLPPEYNVLVRAWKLTEGGFSLPAVLHFTGTPKPWDFKLRLSLKYSLRHLRIICASHAYHRFRADVLGRHDRQQLGRLLDAARTMKQQFSNKKSSPVCSWKCFIYHITGKKNQLRHWRATRDFYRDHTATGIQQTEAVIREIEQWLTTSNGPS